MITTVEIKKITAVSLQEKIIKCNLRNHLKNKQDY